MISSNKLLKIEADVVQREAKYDEMKRRHDVNYDGVGHRDTEAKEGGHTRIVSPLFLLNVQGYAKCWGYIKELYPY